MKIIGEKINGTRKTVAAAIANRDAEFIQNLAKKQVEGGAHWLDVNAGTHPDRDVDDLLQWQQVFGEGFRAVLAFVYWIDAPLTPEPAMFQFRDRWYLLLGVDMEEYRQHMRRRSIKWETVALSSADFRSLARPIDNWL